MLGKSHPTPAVRSDYTTKALNGILLLFEWQMDKHVDHVPRIDYLQFDSNPLNGTDDLRVYHYHQPFINSIAMETYIMVHKLTNNSTVRDGFLAYMSRADDEYDNRLIQGQGSMRHRRVAYALYHSEESGEPLPSVDIPPYNEPMDVEAQGIEDLSVPEPVVVVLPDLPEGRFLNNITISNFGYAYYLTGTTSYITHGDERIGASYGDAAGNFDGSSSLQEVRKNGKNFNESYRRGPNFYAYKNVIAPLSGGGSITLCRWNTSPACQSV
jgi:hypothetical protein